MTRPKETQQDAERRERAQRIADGADMAAEIAQDLATLVREHADTIAGWRVWGLLRRRG